MRGGLVILGVIVSALILTVGVMAGLSQAQDDRPGGTFFDDNETTHEGNIEAIARAGITGGCVAEGTAFCPDLSVTRAQMASFLARALGLDPVAPSFTDVNPGGVHAGNIGAIAAAEITFGCGTNLFCPNDFVTREQMASFLARGLDLPVPGSGPFTDVSGAHLDNVNAIAAAGITLGCNAEGTLFCPELEVTRAQMASFLARGLGLDPIDLPTPIHLLGHEGVCTGSTPSCSASTSVARDDSYYILEGWFYDLPFEDDDGADFVADDTGLILSIDGVGISETVPIPATNYFGTMVRLEGVVLDDLEPGVHTILATWVWNGTSRHTAEVELTVP